MPISAAARAVALAFLTAFVTLFLQVLVHRMVSAKLLNNYAFLVISLTMLGFAASGVLLSRYLARFLTRLNDVVTAAAALFAVTTLGASVIFYQADLGSQAAGSRADFVWTLVRWIPFSLLYAIPFACCGLILGLLLSLRDVPARRVYGYDLVGSALGALTVLPAISALGVEWAALLGCTLLLIGTLLLAPPAALWARGLVAAALVLLTLAGLFLDRLLDLRYPQDSLLAPAQRPGSALVIEHVAWDPLARIEVSRIPAPDPDQSLFPSLIGDDLAFLQRIQLMITQNNYAFTYALDYDGQTDSLRGMDDTIYAGAYQATSVTRPRVCVIGVGGGYDALVALAHDAGDITGVEINGATLRVLTETYRDFFRRWLEDPRVHLVQDDGRHFLETTDQRFDIIQISEVGAYSGSAGVAHVFTENHLYTAEAFDLYLSRLTDPGILNVMRLEMLQPRIVLRVLTTAVQALRRAGAERPADHIMILSQTNGRFAAVLVKRTPFTASEQDRLRAWASTKRWFGLSAAPTLNRRAANLYQTFLAMEDPEKETSFLYWYPLDVSPVDDARPFFFRFSYWRHLFPDNDLIRRHVIPIMEYNVLLLTAIIGLAAVGCIYVPLRFFAADGLRTPHAGRYACYFAGAGLGYMAVEVAFLQKFGLFLGHPNYALSVVLASVLVATGLGSLWSGAILRRLGRIRFVSYLLAALILVEYIVVLPRLPGWIGLPFWARSLIVSGLIMPVGLCLGTFLPSALEHLKGQADRFVPWAWGINGIFSVLGPVVSVALSITWGINTLLLAAIPVYLVVGLSFPETNEPRSAS
jgi:spermidine synthase